MGSLGIRAAAAKSCPVSPAVAILRKGLYACTRVLRSYSRWLFFWFLRSNEGTKTGLCLLSFLLRSLRLTKTVLKPKKKKEAMQALFPPQWRAPRIWVLPKWKTKIVGRPTASIGRSSLSKPKEHRHAMLELKERAIFPVPLMVQDFDIRSNYNFPFNHAQANLTTHEQRRRLHEKFFAQGVKIVDFLLQRRSPAKN